MVLLPARCWLDLSTTAELRLERAVAPSILQEKRIAPLPDGAGAQRLAPPHGVESERGGRASLGVASGSSKKYKKTDVTEGNLPS